jgi:hypothetical protein
MTVIRDSLSVSSEASYGRATNGTGARPAKYARLLLARPVRVMTARDSGC